MRVTMNIKTMVLVVIFASIGLGGCTVAVHAPKSAFSKVEDAEKDGYEIETAFNNVVVKWPGVTWSISGTYLPQSDGTPRALKPAFKYSYSNPQQFQLDVIGPAQCAPSPGVEQQTTEALNALFARIGGWPARGKATVKLAETSRPIRRYALSARLGKTYHLDYETPCFQSDADEAFWFAVMVGFHESTHAALSLSGHQPLNATQREDLAVGAESCLLIELSQGSREFLGTHMRLVGRISDRYQIAERPTSIPAMCLVWRQYMGQVLSERSGTG